MVAVARPVRDGLARTATAALARKLGVARTTVLARLQRPEREGVIVDCTVRLGQAKGEAGVTAIVGISTAPKAARQLSLPTLPNEPARRHDGSRLEAGSKSP